MRRFVCYACGRKIDVNWCSDQRGRDLRCPECGGRVCRESGVGTRQGCGRNSTNIGAADKQNVGNAVGTGQNALGFHQRRVKSNMGRCQGNGNALRGRRSG